MPTVLRAEGFQVRIFLPPPEHGPPHVHVIRGEVVVVIYLPFGSQRVAVRNANGNRDADVLAAVRLVEANSEYLLHAWRRFHG